MGIVPIAAEEHVFEYRGIKFKREQLPLAVAAANTVHVAQGVTVDEHVMHPAITSGGGQYGHTRSLLYVALSRVKRLLGLTLLSPLHARHFTKFKHEIQDIIDEYDSRRRREEQRQQQDCA